MIGCAIVSKKHRVASRRVVVTQDRVEFQTPYFLYECVMVLDQEIAKSVIPVVMTGVTLFYLKLKKELESSCLAAFSSSTLQSKEIDIFVRE